MADSRGSESWRVSLPNKVPWGFVFESKVSRLQALLPVACLLHRESHPEWTPVPTLRLINTQGGLPLQCSLGLGLSPRQSEDLRAASKGLERTAMLSESVGEGGAEEAHGETPQGLKNVSHLFSTLRGPQHCRPTLSLPPAPPAPSCHITFKTRDSLPVAHLLQKG